MGLKFASLKTPLLLALPAKRVGDLLALSIRPSCLSSRQGSLKSAYSIIQLLCQKWWRQCDSMRGRAQSTVWPVCHRQMLCHWSVQNWSRQGNSHSETRHSVIKEPGITLSNPKILSGNCVCSIATRLITSLFFSKHESSLSEMEQMLCTCCGFVYLGTERFTAKIPPAKLAALNLSGTVQPIILFVSCCYIKSFFFSFFF